MKETQEKKYSHLNLGAGQIVLIPICFNLGFIFSLGHLLPFQIVTFGK